MSWLFSQVQVVEYLEENCSDGEQFALLNKTPTPQAYCSQDKMKECLKLSRFGMTFALLTEDLGQELLMWYLEAFPARIFQPQAVGQESQVQGQDYGKNLPVSLAKYDHDTHSLKTAQCSLLEDLTLCSVTLPRWGTMRNGVLYQQPIVERRINGSESGYLATPTATANQLAPSMMKHPSCAMWATPTTMDKLPPKSEESLNREMTVTRPGRSKPANLRDQVSNMQNWPTPQASDNRDRGNLSSRCVERRMKKGKQIGLSQCVSENSGRLNPEWVEWLMNWPINWSSINEFNKDEFKHWEKKSAESIQESGVLRTMWWNFDPSQASHRPRYNEQQKAEHFNTMPEMPRVYTREGKMERPHKEQDLFILRESIYIRESKGEDLLKGVREQIGLDEKKIIPRVTDKSLARMERLTALGNGQVPRVAATAFDILRRRLND